LTASLSARSVIGPPHRGGGRAIREAVAGLPLANPPQAARAVETILDDMLAASWPAGERIAALEHLRVVIMVLSADMERRVGATSHPLPPAAAEAATTVRHLHGKLAEAYALGLQELCAPAGRLPRFKGRVAATAAVLGLVHLAHDLLWGCRQYQAPSAGLWRRAYAVYAFASELGVAERVVRDCLADGASCNARDAYARLLLIAHGDPYRFSARELTQAWQVCQNTAAWCDLVAGRDPTDGNGADAEPDEIAAGPRADSGALRADMAPVERMLDERVALLPAGVDALDLPEPGGGSFTTSVRLVARLRAGWGTIPRRFGRLGAGHALDVVVGMHALHYSLAGNVDFGTFAQNVRGDGITLGKHDLPSAWMAAADATQPRIYRADVLDQSVGGYRLRLGPGEGLRLRIGEVIGLAALIEGADTRDWMVGVVRWLRQEGASMLVGIELLRREASAASVRFGVGKGDILAPQRAVELYAGDGRDEVVLLVTDPLGGGVAAVEAMLSPVACDWRSHAVIARFRPAAVEPLGEACFRVTLVRG
jgi:hypothetical protein